MNSTARLPREEMIENNMGLVHSCAHKFKGRGIEYEDLFQAGCIGLIKASDAFDFDRGVRFSTYAVPVILGEMRRLFRDGGTVKVSRTLKEMSLRAGREREFFCKKYGKEPTISELAKVMQVDETQIAQALSAALPPLSLTYEDDEGSQIDLPSTSHEENLADMISLKQVMERLEPDDQKLIYLRYFKEQTQSKAAEQLGMTQVQVSRREKKILLRLRQQLE
ncbi:MAG: sigma-70 family RNA polymerase sigma factor [Oscillospiraceae bacterium]